MIIKRDIAPNIKEILSQGKVAIIYGARQTGKTTLSRQIAEEFSSEYLYLNADEPDIDEALTGKTSTELKNYIGDAKVLVIDEAQRITNIGLTLKLLHDTMPELKIIATGSSSFELANKVSEPLTGRSITFTLYPLSLKEISQKYESKIERGRIIGQILQYGLYPDIFLSAKASAPQYLANLVENYLYKDLFEFGEIQNADLVRNLLEALALQVGSEVSLNELANLLNVRKETVKRYIELLEKAFVIFRLRPLVRNKRNEIGTYRKVYFYDVGIRNALIGDYNEVDSRKDTGALWENFCIVERMKYNQAKNRFPNSFFWRNYTGAEVDYVEEYQSEMSAYEFKFKRDNAKLPKAFAESYSNSTFQIVNKKNFEQLWN
jgi:hypothetical protein